MRCSYALALLFFFSIVSSGCLRFRHPSYDLIGQASWYGKPYHGRRAANGEIYNMYKLTAAHKTLPFGTMVRVTNLRNGRHVVVRITDRGPFVKGRIIDLSYKAAKKLDMVKDGVVPVGINILH
ncbi:MAG: septal ring lytic transglycosylase RlpA family protein [Candidatus Hydrogenedentes bacterium]|nr:septal ring lytic transglycosylase RlpA family protein [Candidatus Hydrogenedentota bacterium]